MTKQIRFNLTKFQLFLEKFTILGEKELCSIIAGGLSDDLLDYRIKFALTQEQLAKEIGVSRQALSKWELGTVYLKKTN
ncbi:hypothetical protein RyT2_15380 [Pseudolactococcus yaeyamensis]